VFGIPNKADATFARQAGGFSADITTIASALAGDGVLSGLGVSAQSVPDMTVAVATGLVRILGNFAYVSAQNVTIAAADASNPRIDLVVCDYNGTVSRTAGTAAALPVPPAIPANSIQLAQIYVQAAASSLSNTNIVDKRPTCIDYFDLYDEFMSQGLVTTGNISDLAWALTAATGGTPTWPAGTALHPGLLQIITGGTSGNNQRLHLGVASNSTPLHAADIARIEALVAIPTITTLAIKFGLGVDLNDATAASLGTAGAFFEFVPATSAKWRASTRAASTSSTTADPGSNVVAGNYYKLTILRLQNGNWQFAINDVLIATNTSNLPNVALNVGFLVHTLTAAARTLNIDYFGLNFKPLGQRFT